ncbi:MAG: hypothetical protein AUH81_12860 [Candidatus Rokubacteria bacterium 13_1_40CM_4_69_5]|nr:MAG: hypothetical protein AUH81_12860 [Candidatus Rokubacteria bacterium 13_1_40CM_4_69_5]
MSISSAWGGRFRALAVSPEGRVAAAIAVGTLGLAHILPPYYVHILVLAQIFAIFSLSLDVLMGYVGLPSLGHAAFFGVAGYTVGLLVVRYGVGWANAALAALMVSALVAALFGLIAIRAVDVFFMMITLALCQILWGIANRWGSFTGGYNGLPGIARPMAALESTLVFSYVATAVLCLVAVVVVRFVRSPFGLTLQGIRDRESRMSILGYNVWLHKYATFVICGVLAAVAGVLNAFYTGFVSPADLSIRMSAEATLMVVLGGTGTLIGPIVGSGIIVGLRNVLSAYMERWPLVLGSIFMLTVILAPNGIVGWVRARRLKASRAEPPDREAWSDAGPRVPISVGALGSRQGLPDRSGPAALELRSASRVFGGLLAVNDVSFSIARGERVAVLGPNGAGKTTLFNLVSGTLRVSGGAVLLFGEDVTRLPAHRRAVRGLARTFQIATLFPTLSVIDNVRLALLGLDRAKFDMLRAVDDRAELTQRARTLLETFDLWHRHEVPVRELSHGEQRLLEVVLAVAGRPRILLLDEPTAGVSAAEIEPIIRILHELDASMTVLVIEHDMDVAFRLAERILVLHQGKLLRAGTPDQIKTDPAVAEIYLGAG